MKEVIQKIQKLYEHEKSVYENSISHISRGDGFSRMCAYGICLDILEEHENKNSTKVKEK